MFDTFGFDNRKMLKNAKLGTAVKIRQLLCSCTVGISLIALTFLIVSDMDFNVRYLEHEYPGVVPSSYFVRKLDSKDKDVVMSGLWYLTRRKDPIAVPKVLPLLESEDDYLWLNAAIYTGTCGRQEAIPFLIKALRHTASRADTETVECLRVLTGQNFGPDFDLWQGWWLGQHPVGGFDWTSHLGYKPRLPVP